MLRLHIKHTRWYQECLLIVTDCTLKSQISYSSRPFGKIPKKSSIWTFGACCVHPNLCPFNTCKKKADDKALKSTVYCPHFQYHIHEPKWIDNPESQSPYTQFPINFTAFGVRQKNTVGTSRWRQYWVQAFCISIQLGVCCQQLSSCKILKLVGNLLFAIDYDYF